MDDRLSWIRAALVTALGRWPALVEAVPAGLLACPPAPGEQSALQCLLHLLQTERSVFPVRVHSFLREQDLAAFAPEAQRRDAACQSAAGLSRLYLDNPALVARLGPRGAASVTGAGHLGRIYSTSGRSYYSDHDAETRGV